jgi:hypothetical protein
MSKKPAKTAKSKKAKSDKPRKLTAAELSDTDRQRLLLAHKRKLKPLLLTETAAKKAVSNAYELAKKEGITKKELQLAFLLDTDEGAEKVKLQMQQILNVDRWVGGELGEQLEMFPKPSVMVKAYADGKRAALEDEPARPPESLSQNAANEWLAGHAAGREALNVSRAEGFKPLASVVREVMPAPIGDQSATHHEAA